MSGWESDFDVADPPGVWPSLYIDAGAFLATPLLMEIKLLCGDLDSATNRAHIEVDTISEKLPNLMNLMRLWLLDFRVRAMHSRYLRRLNK